MLQLKYTYRTEIKFSENVFSHHYLLRCIPREWEAQKILESRCIILPEDNKTYSVDSFGNTLISGYIDKYHDSFEFISEGIVSLGTYKIVEPLNPLFLYKSSLTQPVNKILLLSKKLIFPVSASIYDKILAISNAINEELKYVPGITSIQTTAEEAMELGQGVCQDFAHIMIAICREHGIAARYVSGFIQGEGFTHAWVEYYDNGGWYGFDPTHNCSIVSEYIKIAHGRDYQDCAVDRGIFKGLAQQYLKVSVKVENLTDEEMQMQQQ